MPVLVMYKLSGIHVDPQRCNPLLVGGHVPARGGLVCVLGEVWVPAGVVYKHSVFFDLSVAEFLGCVHATGCA